MDSLPNGPLKTQPLIRFLSPLTQVHQARQEQLELRDQQGNLARLLLVLRVQLVLLAIQVAQEFQVSNLNWGRRSKPISRLCNFYN